MTLSPKTLQLTKGETGSISATVIPAGSPITWATSDSTIATVDNGTVTALESGSVTITATITVGGVEYSDTCAVEVEAAPIEWETVREFTSPDIWNNESYWIQQFYIDDTRKTYIEYDNAIESIRLMLNPDTGSSSTLYADIRPSLEGFEFDTATYDYALAVRYVNPRLGESHPTISLTNAEANMLVSDGWSPFEIPFTENEYGEVTLPLIVRESGERAFTMQIKHDSGSPYVRWIQFDLIRKMK